MRNTKTGRKTAMKEQATTKTSKRTKKSMSSGSRVVNAKSLQRKGKKRDGEHALYKKEIEQLDYQGKARVPAENAPQRTEGHSQPGATYDPTPDTYVPPRGHTALERNVQSERVAGMRRDRARMGRTGIPNAGGRRRRG